MKLVELYGDKVLGAIKGLDRIRFRGTLRWLANADGLRSFLSRSGVLLKDFKDWALEKTAQVRDDCARQAQALAIPTLYLRSSALDKEKEAAGSRASALSPMAPSASLASWSPAWPRRWKATVPANSWS